MWSLMTNLLMRLRNFLSINYITHLFPPPKIYNTEYSISLTASPLHDNYSFDIVLASVQWINYLWWDAEEETSKETSCSKAMHVYCLSCYVTAWHMWECRPATCVAYSSSSHSFLTKLWSDYYYFTNSILIESSYIWLVIDIIHINKNHFCQCGIEPVSKYHLPVYLP